MIQVTPQMRILLAIEPQDFRKGIDGLARVSQAVLGEDPFSGTLFIFRNRAGTSLKVLVYDGQGFWLAQKRLSRGRLSWWPKERGDVSCRLAAHELQTLLWNGNPDVTPVAPQWKPVALSP